jgi:hypothetical protein
MLRDNNRKSAAKWLGDASRQTPNYLGVKVLNIPIVFSYLYKLKEKRSSVLYVGTIESNTQYTK